MWAVWQEGFPVGATVGTQLGHFEEVGMQLRGQFVEAVDGFIVG